MSKITLSSTHIDSHGTRIMLSALQGMAEQINGNTKVRWGLEHDMSLPPLGIIDLAEIIQGEDGEYYLLASLVPYDKSFSFQLSDGEVLIKESFDQPVIYRENIENTIDVTTISFDPVNVGSFEDLSLLYEDIRSESTSEFIEKAIFRKSLIPDPEIIVQVTNHLADLLFTYKIVEKAVDKFQEKLAEDFYDLIKVTAKKAAAKLLPIDKPITYIFKGTYNGVIFELLVRIRSSKLLLDCISIAKLQVVAEQINHLKGTFDPVKVQLMYNLDKNAWELNYLIDINGAVVGSVKSFDRQKATIKKMTLNYPVSS